MTENTRQDHNNTVVNPVSENGNGPDSPKCGPDLSEHVTVTETETESITIPLADLETGLEVPSTATCELEIVTIGPASMVVEVERKGLTYIVEQSGASAELTGVYGSDEHVGRPAHVPAWLASVCELVGIDEVTL